VVEAEVQVEEVSQRKGVDQSETEEEEDKKAGEGVEGRYAEVS
jgi:hypothetical protein